MMSGGNGRSVFRMACFAAICCALGPLGQGSGGASPAAAAELVLEPKLRHLRNAEPREWTEFPEKAEATELTYSFEVTEAFRPQTLRLRHRDLRRDWLISLDGKVLIRLPQGDQDATTFWSLDAERFKPGRHELTISCKDKAADDVMIGELRLDTRSKAEMLGEATVEVEVRQFKETGGFGDLVPCRLTLVDERGSLMTVGIEPEPRLAIRPGVIYTLDGRAKFTVPAGKYVLYASRGFEYSVAETKLELKAGDVAKPRLDLSHEVYFVRDLVSCDPHVHTLTHSGHGDCTLEERIVTLAGEGVKLPIATDHNKVIDLWPTIEKLGAEKHFEARFRAVMIGEEVTTKVGHFNVFPLDPARRPVDHEGKSWDEINAAIAVETKRPIAPSHTLTILNHARDIHNGFRPFGPERFIRVAGEDVTEWKLPANAMEVFNSGSTQNEPTQLFHDWQALLNRGRRVTPIGSSDSHDVARYIVGQGRTYLVEFEGLGLVEAAKAGFVWSGMGLLCDMYVNEEFGILASPLPRSDEYRVQVGVMGPSWVRVDEVRLFVNGSEFEQTPIESEIPSGTGIQRVVTWTLPKLKHDVHIAALAVGPGVDKPYWPIAKPYQPTSPDWKSYVIGCSGSMQLDADGNGFYSSPYDYAKRLVRMSGGKDAKLVAALKDYDEAVAVQAASVARAKGRERFDAFLAAVEKDGAPQTKSGVRKYVEGWRATLVGGANSAPSGAK